MALPIKEKKIRQGVRTCADLPDRVAEADGEEEIVSKFRFREVYGSLYQSWSSEEEMLTIKQKLAGLIKSEQEESITEVVKLTGQEVKKAVSKMKVAKADVSGAFSSDALLHAPDSLFDNLALIYRNCDSITAYLCLPATVEELT